MPNFPINTQEEWDAAVQQEYGDVAGLQGQITTLTGERDTHANTIADLQKQIKQYELGDLRRRVAQQKGLPMEFAGRLTGETEEDIGKDADTLVTLFKAAKGPDPTFDNTPKKEAKDAALSDMLKDLRGE